MKRWQQALTRRNFLQLSAGAGTTLLLAGCERTPQPPKTAAAVPAAAPVAQKTLSASEFMQAYGPIDRTLGESSERSFYGDRNERPHGILWNRAGYLASKKVEGPDEETALVILGGGMSGLFSAFRLRAHKPIVLEQAARFGGNAKGQSWRGIDYSIGAAYLDAPHAGSPMAEYFRDLGLDDLLVQRSTPDPVEVQGKLYPKFWEGESEPKFKDKYLKMSRFFASLVAEKERAFPFIPSLEEKHLASVRHYDTFTLRDLLDKVTSGLPKQLAIALEHYCWSTYAASSTELSAAAGLNFLAQEVEPIRVGAGGNAKVGERLLERLLTTLPQGNLRAKCIGVQVKVEGDRVVVLYEDGEGKLRRIRAKAAILACPKFAVGKMLDGIEPERAQAISELRFRSYMTASVLVNKPMPRGIFDLFMLGRATTDPNNARKSQEEMNGTDLIFANFAAERAAKDAAANVLTFYRSFPYDGARAELIGPGAYEQNRKRFEEQIARDILPLLALEQRNIVDIRLSLWGHALPLAKQGIYSGDVVPRLRKPFSSRVFFVEQDNWAYPSTQTGATDVALQQAEIERVLT